MMAPIARWITEAFPITVLVTSASLSPSLQGVTFYDPTNGSQLFATLSSAFLRCRLHGVTITMTDTDSAFSVMWGWNWNNPTQTGPIPDSLPSAPADDAGMMVTTGRGRWMPGTNPAMTRYKFYRPNLVFEIQALKTQNDVIGDLVYRLPSGSKATFVLVFTFSLGEWQPL
jgi:hypothetical protein